MAPMSPDTSINAGRAETATKDFPSIAGLYEAGMRNQLQASQASAQLAAQVGMHGASLGQRATAQSDALRERQNEFAQSREVSERDQFMAHQQQQEIQQRAQAQA